MLTVTRTDKKEVKQVINDLRSKGNIMGNNSASTKKKDSGGNLSKLATDSLNSGK